MYKGNHMEKPPNMALSSSLPLIRSHFLRRRFYLIMQGGFFNGRAATTGGGFILLRLLQVVQITMTVSVPLADFDNVEQDKFINNVATLWGT